MEYSPQLMLAAALLLQTGVAWLVQGRSAIAAMRARLLLAAACLLFCLPPWPLVMLGAHLLLFAALAGEIGYWAERFQHEAWRQRLLIPLALGAGGFAAASMLSDVQWSLALAICAMLFGAWAGLLWRKSSEPMLRRFAMLLACALALSGLLAFNNWARNLFPPAFALLLLCIFSISHGLALLGDSREQQHTVERLALSDPLTGAPNQRAFHAALGPWLALARRPGNPCALIMIDLDHFKRVNDDYGHAVGDLVLQMVAQAGQRQLRDSDMLARLGGAGFVVLLPRTGLDDALLVAERMRAAIAAMPIKTGRALLHVSASIGVATLRADDSALSLLKRADEALAAAKLAGRNTVLAAGENIASAA
ncbi:GGDEF domain-containing protein [Massilia sp. W12]|uniref:GGDEF domain-containing protein n=1 Tax=Massilia sp. W12 TaxID=3126507 RepID=UPI0030CED6B4